MCSGGGFRDLSLMELVNLCCGREGVKEVRVTLKECGRLQDPEKLYLQFK